MKKLGVLLSALVVLASGIGAQQQPPPVEKRPPSLWAGMPRAPRMTFVQTMPTLAESNAAAAAGVAGLQSTGVWKVEFEYNFTLDPACSATVKTDCVMRFEHQEETGGTGVWVKVADIPPPANPIGPAVTVSAPLQSKGYGDKKGRIVAVAVDINGAAILSRPSQEFTYRREPNPPQNPKVVAQ